MIHRFIPPGRPSHYRPSLRITTVHRTVQLSKLIGFEIPRSLSVYSLPQNGCSVRLIHCMQHEIRQIWHFSPLQQICCSQHYRCDQLQSTVSELSIEDGNDSATFVIFDREMTKLTQQDAAALALEEINGKDSQSQDLLRCLQELAGKDNIFSDTSHSRVAST